MTTQIASVKEVYLLHLKGRNFLLNVDANLSNEREG